MPKRRKEEESPERPDAFERLVRGEASAQRDAVSRPVQAGSDDSSDQGLAAAAQAEAERRKGTAQGMRKLSIDLPPELYRWLKRRAAEEDVPMAAIVQALIEAYQAGEVTPAVQAVVDRRGRR